MGGHYVIDGIHERKICTDMRKDYKDAIGGNVASHFALGIPR